MAETARRCRNCNSELSGEYCAQCGQREGRAEQRFLDVAGELGGDFINLDSRLWRTLFGLLFRPGFLSAEFIAGRRARYIPPLRFYLVVSFLVFMVISLGTTLSLSPDEGIRAELEGDVVVSIDADEVEVEQGGDEAEDPNEWSPRIELAGEDSPQWLKDVDNRMEQNASRLQDNPNAFLEALVDYLPQMMFLLLPLFALLIKLCYLGSAFHYLQHLVFSLHYHSFVYLLYLLAQLVELFAVHADGWLALGLVIYLPLALRRCYSSGWFGALGKSLFIYLTYGVMLILGFAGVAVLALALL